jgi:Domain of unknown function (DUF6894)
LVNGPAKVPPFPMNLYSSGQSLDYCGGLATSPKRREGLEPARPIRHCRQHPCRVRAGAGTKGQRLRYFFHVTNGTITFQDESGQDLFSPDAVQAQAGVIATELAQRGDDVQEPSSPARLGGLGFWHEPRALSVVPRAGGKTDGDGDTISIPVLKEGSGDPEYRKTMLQDSGSGLDASNRGGTNQPAR